MTTMNRRARRSSPAARSSATRGITTPLDPAIKTKNAWITVLAAP